MSGRASARNGASGENVVVTSAVSPTAGAELPADAVAQLAARFRLFRSMGQEELERFLMETEAHLVEDRPRKTMLRKGQTVEDISFLIDGWAMRFDILPDGRRQILSFLMPGDAACMRMVAAGQLPYSVQSISATCRWVFPVERFRKAVSANSKHAEEFFRLYNHWLVLMDSIVTDIGRRKAPERIARFLTRVCARVWAIEGRRSTRIELPLNQGHIADAMGLTPVHVNRTLMSLREMNALSLDRSVLSIHDLDRLLAAGEMSQAEFDALESLFREKGGDK